MRKQELLHIHGLLSEVEDYLEENYLEEGEIDTEEYDSLGVRPTSVHKSKPDHNEAVFSLSNAITGTVTEYLEDEKYSNSDGSTTGKATGD